MHAARLVNFQLTPPFHVPHPSISYYCNAERHNTTRRSLPSYAMSALLFLLIILSVAGIADGLKCYCDEDVFTGGCKSFATGDMFYTTICLKDEGEGDTCYTFDGVEVSSNRPRRKRGCMKAADCTITEKGDFEIDGLNVYGSMYCCTDYDMCNVEYPSYTTTTTSTTTNSTTTTTTPTTTRTPPATTTPKTESETATTNTTRQPQECYCHVLVNGIELSKSQYALDNCYDNKKVCEPRIDGCGRLEGKRGFDGSYIIAYGCMGQCEPRNNELITLNGENNVNYTLDGSVWCCAEPMCNAAITCAAVRWLVLVTTVVWSMM